MARRGTGIGRAPATQSVFSTTDTITLWLTLLAVMIGAAALVVTAVGVWVGLMAIWGYKTFQEELTKEAAKTAERTTLDYIKGEQVRAWLTTEGKAVLSNLFKDWKESNELASSQPPQNQSTLGTGEESEKVGKVRKKRP